MKVLGIALIAIGILMLVFRGFSFTQEKKIVDTGPVEINSKQKKSINWPLYAGIITLPPWSVSPPTTVTKKGRYIITNESHTSFHYLNLRGRCLHRLLFRK